MRGESGQASVELVAVLPFVLLVAAIAWQLALAGQAAWLCANAARVAARADAVGADAGGGRAQRAAEVAASAGCRWSGRSGGAVRVRLRVPLIVRRWGAR